jgi:hypothetical protein
VPPPLPAKHFTVLREAAVRKRVPINLNIANALQWLGTLYRNPADAVKEHISNAIDEHLKALEQGVAQPVCRVSFHLARRSVQVHYPYGMDRGEFEQALHRVAGSAKRRSKAPQIGQLGIGIFILQQNGRKCAFLSRMHDEDETRPGDGPSGPKAATMRRRPSREMLPRARWEQAPRSRPGQGPNMRSRRAEA